MTRLNELINELCPDGVEYIDFFSLCNYIRGITYNKTNEINDGSVGIKVLRANNITLETNSLNFEEVKIVSPDVKIKASQWLKYQDILICAGSGSKEHIGKVAYIFNDMNFTFGGFMGVIRPKGDSLNSRFLFHILTSDIFKRHLAKTSGAASATINNINNDTWKNFKIPVPPLPVQEEIVRILDKFTSLEAELEAELEARRVQYEYYRDALLASAGSATNGTFPVIGTAKNEVVEPVETTLGEVAKIKNGKDYKHLSEGKYTVYGSGGIMTYVNDFCYDKPSVLIPRKGSINNLFYVDEPFWNVDTVFYTEINEKIITPKYFYYLLKKEHLEKLNTAGGVPSLTQAVLNKVILSIPPLEVQRRIVNVLDNFDAICSDLKIGLPAEIDARKKQYEYYRDLLLTFAERGNTIFTEQNRTEQNRTEQMR